MLRSDLSHLAELVFGWERFVLTDLLEDGKHEGLFLFDVIDEYCLLVGITIPVFRLVLLVVVWLLRDDTVGLAYARLSPDPEVVRLGIAFKGVWAVSTVVVEIDRTLDLGIVLEIDVTVGDRLLGPHGEKLLVASLLVALDVESGWLNSEGPGTFLPGLVLHAVDFRPVVHTHFGKVGSWAVLLERCPALVGVEVHEPLDVDGSLLALLHLTCDIDGTGLGKPGLEVILCWCSGEIGIVECAYPHPALKSGG